MLMAAAEFPVAKTKRQFLLTSRGPWLWSIGLHNRFNDRVAVGSIPAREKIERVAKNFSNQMD